MNRLSKLGIPALLGGVLLASSPTYASNDAMIELLKVLKDQGTISEEAYSVLKNSAEADEERTNAKIEETADERLAKVESFADKIKWAERFKLKGDLRLRYEKDQANGDGNDTRVRWRGRARLGVEATVTDSIKVGFGIASGSDDPRSTNQTFDDNFDTKSLNLDLFFAEWQATEWAKVIGGKFSRKNYLYAASDLLWDGDIRPEGVSANFSFDNSLGNTFANVGYWFLDEFDSDSEFIDGEDDPEIYYAQIGQKFKKDRVFGTVSAIYYEFSDLEGSVFNSDGGSEGTNTLDENGLLANDFDAYGFSGEIGLENIFRDYAFSIFSDYIKNTDSDEDTGYSIGFKFGDKKVKNRHDWQFKYTYADLEIDAFPDIFPDSDRLGGATGLNANEFALKYGIAKNVHIALDYYDSNADSSNLESNDESLFQADVIYKF